MKKAIRGALLGSLALGIVFSTGVNTANAEDKPAKPVPNQETIDMKQKSEKKVIQVGSDVGLLTNKEKKALDKKQEVIDKREARYAASGGKMTKMEAKEIDRMQNNAGDQIKKQLGDKQTKQAEQKKAEEKKQNP